MNTKRNLVRIFYKSDSEKKDTSLQRSDVQTPARRTSQPSQVVTSQPSRVTSSQQPARVTMAQQPSQRTSQFSRVTVPQTSPVVASQFSRVVASQPSRGMSQPFCVVAPQPSEGTSQRSHMTAPLPSWVTAPQPSPVVASQFSRVVASHPSQEMSQPSRMEALQPSGGTLQLSRTVAPQPSRGTSQLSQAVAPQPSRGMSQPSRGNASLAQPPAPPILTPTPPAQPCCRRLSNLLSQSPRHLQLHSSPVCKHISSQEKDQFRLPRAKLASESAGGAEGSSGTAMPLPPIQPPAAAVAGPATTRAQPKKQVAPKNRPPPPRDKNPKGAPQKGTNPLPNSRLCASQQQQQLQPQPPQQPRRSCPTRTRGRSVRNPGTAVRPEPEAAVHTPQYTINLTPETTWLLMRRHQENQWGWINPFGGMGPLPGSQSRASLDLTSLMQISLVNEHNNEVYEEDPAPGVVDQELVRRCTEWLRGVEEAKREGKLEPVPQLDDP